MATTMEYVLMADRVYAASDDNRTFVPAGWEELTWNRDDGVTGFSVGAYQNDQTGEIVIAYTGTNDKSLDWVSNVAAGSGVVAAPQVNNSSVPFFPPFFHTVHIALPVLHSDCC